MVCCDCAPLAIQNASLQRRLERSVADIRDLEAERGELAAEVTRQTDRVRALAVAIAGTP